MYEYYWNFPQGNNKVTKTYFCPYCETLVSGKIHNEVRCKGYSPVYGLIDESEYLILECPSCNKPTIYNIKTRTTSPNGQILRKLNNIPENLKILYEEVGNCISSECYTSAVMMARTILMYIAIDKGADKNKSFQFYVNYISDEGYIPPDGKSWVDKIRQMGNEANHDLKIFKKEDAELIGKFLSYLLIFIYELPELV